MSIIPTQEQASCIRQQVLFEHKIIKQKLQPVQRRAALHRLWANTYHRVPTDEKELEKILPSTLSRDEKTQLLYGALAEGQVQFFRIFNTTLTKTELRDKLNENGLSTIISTLDNRLQCEFKNAIRFKSD